MYEYEDYYEATEVDCIVREAIDKIKATIKQEAMADIEADKQKIERLESENRRLQKEWVSAVDAKKTVESTNSILSALSSSMTKEKSIKLLYLAYDPDFDEPVSERVPEWFRALINFNSHKDDVITFLRRCGWDIPNKAYALKLPCHYNEQELDYFFETLRNHYVCNCQIYSHNLEFWYPTRWDAPVDNMKTQYSEIPWQFLLRNKLLDSDKYIDKMANAINKGDNGGWFIKVFSYGCLSDESKRKLINKLILTKKPSNEYENTIRQNVARITEPTLLEDYYNKFVNKYNFENDLHGMPREYAIRWLTKDCPKEEVYRYVNKFDLTPEEKIEAMKRMI